MAVGAIRAMRAYSSVSFTQPLNYALSNNSEVSSAYAQSVQQPSEVASAVDPVSPVGYPNAQKINASKLDPVEASAMFNEVAESFGGSITGYGSKGTGSTYNTIGQNIDILV
ncbi:MAG: hypothetical protein K6G87_05950 [Butyrivibrio sp.]|uniref:hypothetical protein n=1 Tax=Butyrivibrio sp. TaxID=28121 RepID=UPI0025E7F517|nr:hypothetical protein [Butyrivibrio sp.]MCR5770766.1 hypothetical protein [Butyrivibrio sp.]